MIYNQREVIIGKYGKIIITNGKNKINNAK
jgi:hypothetical protein